MTTKENKVAEMRRESEHAPICAACGEEWPCAAKRIDRQVASFRLHLDRLCTHCGTEVRPGQNCISGGGRIYHTAKRYAACLRAAQAHLGMWE